MRENEKTNIKYESESFFNYYSEKRMTWEEFYPSEKKILKRIIDRYAQGFELLDAGCGCGGLGKALSDNFNIKYYTGIDCNKKEIEYASEHNCLPIPHQYICEDIAGYNEDKQYDIVTSLGCIDFNIDVTGMLKSCWAKVKKGGYLVISVRLTNNETINNVNEAYQRLDDNEVANYVVFNIEDFLKMILGLKDNPADLIEAFGYWHAPADGTVVKYDKLCMSVAAIRKALTNEYDGKPTVHFEFPDDLWGGNINV
ncbi:MAG: class I SAM-dependent methyltransferase [Lachnospiraceae bacterium]|nr:class I SAM-dependent methyltransferase [Lachnospiraceae bacterium]